MRSTRHLTPTDRESGSVLVLAMLVALVILGVGLSALFLSNSGMRVSGNLSRRQEALGAAETGTERALDILRANATNDWDSLLGDLTSATACTAATGYTAVKGNILCDGTTPLENVQVVATVPTGLPASYGDYLTYTVYIRNDPTETASSKLGPFDDEDKRVVIRSEGLGRDGVSFFAIETIIAVVFPQDGTGMTSQHLGGPTGSSSYQGTAIKVGP